MYATSQQATLAVTHLRAWGFAADVITLVTPSTVSGDPADAVAAGNVLKREAEVYAREIRAGRSLVSIQAPFGTGRIATDILDRAGPVASAVVPTQDRIPPWDDAAPLSSMLWLPTIVRHPAPFSAFWVLPLLAWKGRTLGSLLGFAELSPRRPMTSSLGLPLLGGSAAPFSSLLHLPLLAGGKR